jgi:hypothetical protein
MSCDRRVTVVKKNSRHRICKGCRSKKRKRAPGEGDGDEKRRIMAEGDNSDVLDAAGVLGAMNYGKSSASDAISSQALGGNSVQDAAGVLGEMNNEKFSS